MAFQRPTLTEIIDRAVADMSSRVVGVDGAVLRRSVLGVIARTLAGASHELHGRLDYIARQVIIDTADVEYLERWASVWGVRRKAAEFASGSVVFTGTSGAVIAAGAVLQRQDGALFETTAEATIIGASATVTVRAQAAGVAGNTAAGIKLTMQQPSSGVQVAATVASGGITGGSDTESDDALRARLLARIQQPPHGGAAHDYVAWALEVPGVTRAWVAPMEMGPGTVTVRFVRDGDGDIIPDTAEVDAVQEYIEERRPVTAEVFVVAPIDAPQDFTVQLSPNSASAQAAVTAELADLLQREGEPGGTILVSHVREAISIAAGEFDHVLVSPTSNIALGSGEIATLGTITFEPIP
ncbi:MAG TPA: baseplate J/gp47 family protein [Pseudoxanthomonas sp.]